MIVLSNHLQEVNGEEWIQAEKAALLGPVQTIPLEYPQLNCHSVDIFLPPLPGTIPDKLVDMLLTEIQTESSNTIIAYRGQHRWVQIFEPVRVEEPKETTPRLRKEGTYLITGGLGGLGLTLAAHMAQNKQARLALLSRTSLPNREDWSAWLAGHDEKDPISQKIQKVQEIEQLGSRVLIIQADVSDQIEMQSAVTHVLQEFGPIHGVIHAAGIPGGGLIQLRTRERSESVMAAKTRGSLNLMEALKNQPLDFIILCSSINAIVGRLGQVDYIAANSFLDSLIHAHPDLPIIDINWETWRDVGMAAEAARNQSVGAGKWKMLPGNNHPLASRRQVISDDADIFICQMQVGTNWELNEHWVLNKPTLPGTAYLEMVRAAFEAHTGLSNMEFRDVVFMRPLILEGDEQKEVWTLIKKRGIGFLFSVMSGTDQKDWQEHAQGTVFPLKVPESLQRDLTGIKKRCSDLQIEAPLEQTRLGHFRLERGNLIRGIEHDHNDPIHSILITDETGAELRSMEFGPRWRTLKWVWLGLQEGLGFFELPKTFGGDIDIYKLHPALLDFAASFLRLFKSTGSYLPLSYKRLKMNGPLPQKFYSYARFASQHPPNNLTLSFDISILDEQGKELVSIEEFTVVRIDDTTKLGANKVATSPVQFFNHDPTLGLAEGISLTESLSPAEGVKIFDRVLSSGLSRVIISTRNLQARIEQSRAASKALILGNAQQAVSRTRHPRPQLMTAYAAPRTQIEQKLTEIWQEVLGIEQVGIHDNFFELGGDSLLITRVHAKFLEAFEHDMPVANLMQYPTIAMLAQQLGQADTKMKEPSFDAVRERTNKQKEAMQLRKQKMLKQRKH